MDTVAALADDLVDLLAQEDPLNDFLQGFPGYQGRLADLDEDAEARLRDRASAIAARAATAAGQDRVTRELVVQQAGALVTRLDARLVEHTMQDFQVAPATVLLRRLPDVAVDGAAGRRGLLDRLAAVPDFLAAAARRHRAGLAAGRLPVASLVRATVGFLDDYLADPGGDPLRGAALPSLLAAERERLLETAVRPAFAAYRAVLDAELAPAGRPDERPGLCWLPGGEQTYAALARMHTTTERTPEQLHRTGLRVIEELSAEYVAVGARVFGVRTVGEVHQRMRTDPALRWDSAEQVITEARAAIARAEQAAPGWFGRLPAHRCRVEPTPAAKAPTASTAYYVPGPMDGSAPGTYFANTHQATRRDRILAEASAFHEAVPGHHFQISIAQELTSLPRLRKVAWINAYLEGWALYCERLADEMGLYSGDIARLGLLAMDSMRAARLVVDTGLHAFGWSRQQVVDYLRVNTVMTELEIQQETNRYIEMPGQALAYLTGRLEIQRMRAAAEARLGARFDLRAFHDLVLGGGPLPMTVLATVIENDL